MKTISTSFFLLFFGLYSNLLIGQQCATIFAQNTKSGGIHALSTKSQLMVIRTDYDYSIEFKNSKEGVVAVITTTGHNSTLIKPMLKGDKLMFIAASGEKRPYDFIYDSEKTTIKGRAAYINTLQLDLAAIKWLAENKIVAIRFVDMVSSKMFPYSLDENRQALLTEMASCFFIDLDPSMVKNKVLNNKPILNENNFITKTQLDSPSTHNPHHDITDIRSVQHHYGEFHHLQPLWTMDDMTLSSEAAAKKYLALLDKELLALPNQTAKDIQLNTEIGIAFFEQKQYNKAIPYFQKALKAIIESTIGQENKPIIESMLATIYVSKEQYFLAAQHNKEALEHWKNGWTDSIELELSFQAYMNQGRIFQNLDSSKNNPNWYVEGIKPEQKNWKEELKKRNLAPIVFLDNPDKTVDYNLALLSFKNAAELIGQFDKKKQVNKKIELQLALGALYFEVDNMEESKKYYNEVLKLIQEYYDPKHPLFSVTTQMLSEIALIQKSYSDALKLANDALGNLVVDESLLKNLDKISNPFEVLNAITTKNIISYEQNNNKNSEEALKKMLKEYEIASKLLLELRKTHQNDGADYQLEKATDKLSQHAVVVCDKLHHMTNKKEYLDSAFDYAELSKSGLMYEITQDLISVAGIPKEEIEKENGYKAQLAYLKSQVFYELQQGVNKNESRIQKLEDAIGKITKEHQKTIQHFEQKYPQYHALKYKHESVKIADLQRALMPNETFLEYVATDSFIYVLAITPTEVKSQFTNLTEPLSKTVKTLHFALKRNNPEMYEYSGNKLYKAVIGELAPFLKGKKLIIAPDAELYYIPFGVLPTSRTKMQGSERNIYSEIHYLIEDHPICYNHSATAFVNGKYQQHRRSNHQIATWAPQFDSMHEIIKAKGLGEHLEALPEAKKEANLIAQLFGNSAHIGQDATELKFKQQASLYSILHIATHGVLNDESPLSSSLILSNEGTEDGILMASELYEMQLNANMAVLSACNSGMGKLSKAEGVVGVASGFAYAGVPNIVMSKWPVSDWSTAVLMKSFYENLQTGMPKDEALQLAKIKYLADNKGNEKLLAPFLWGGFVINGNTEPIDALSPLDWTYWWLGGLLVGVLVVFWGWYRLSIKK